MTEPAPLLFGDSCPQHADQPLSRVTRARVEWGGGVHWLVTATYACGHRHTQLSPAPPDEVRDTSGSTHPVLDEDR